MQARVAEQRATGLDLKHRAGERGQLGADDGGERLDRRRRRRVRAAVERAAGRVAGQREAAADVDLPRPPAAGRRAELVDQRGVGAQRDGERAGVGDVAREVHVDAERVEPLGVRDQRPRRRDLVARDARLVGEHHVGHWHRRLEQVQTASVSSGVWGRSRSRTSARRPSPRATASSRSSSSSESTVTRTPARTARVSTASSLAGPLNEIRSGGVPARSAASSSHGPTRRSRHPRRRATGAAPASVGLERGQQAHRAGPRGRERGVDAAQVAAQLIGRDHVQWRPVALGKLVRVARLHLHPAVARRQTVVDHGGHGYVCLWSFR